MGRVLIFDCCNKGHDRLFRNANAIERRIDHEIVRVNRPRPFLKEPDVETLLMTGEQHFDFFPAKHPLSRRVRGCTRATLLRRAPERHTEADHRPL